MQIKVTERYKRYYYRPFRMSEIKQTDNTKCWQGREGTGTLYVAGENVKQCNHFRKQCDRYIPTI